MVGLQKRTQPPLAQPTRVRRAGIAGEKRERDRTVQVAEQADWARPEPLKLRPQLVGQRDPCTDQVLARAGQRPKRLGLIQVGLEQPEAMSVGPRQLAQHEPVKPIGLPA